MTANFLLITINPNLDFELRACYQSLAIAEEEYLQ